MKDISDEQVCRAVQAYQDATTIALETGGEWPPYPYEALSLETGQSEKVCFRAMERADMRDLLDYGVSLRTAWLTEGGCALIGIPFPTDLA